MVMGAPGLRGGQCGTMSVSVGGAAQSVSCTRYGDFHRVRSSETCFDYYHHDWVACEDGTVYHLAFEYVGTTCYPIIV